MRQPTFGGFEVVVPTDMSGFKAARPLSGAVKVETFGINKQFAGRVTPPADMMEAARKSLSEQAFSDLMEQTGGKVPTPEQLCKMVDSIRVA